MRNLGTRWSLAVWVTAAVLLVSCSKNPTAPKVAVTDPPASPDVYPPIPTPASPTAVTPDTSESYYEIVPIDKKQIDFAPTWTEGVFTWHIEVQTEHEGLLSLYWVGDPPGPYFDGTRRNTGLVFEGGQVDLREPVTDRSPGFCSATRRLEFVKAGKVLGSPVNPDMDPNKVSFVYGAGATQTFPTTNYDAVFGGSWWRDENPDFGETARGASYYVAALSAQKLANPVFVKRQRFWQRVPLNGPKDPNDPNDPNRGGSLKSVIIDPGASYSVTYTRLQGVDNNVSDTFTRTLSGEVGASTPQNILDAKLGASLSDAFETSVTDHEETSTTESQTFNGQDGQTVVYSVWRTVERYTFVDKDGNPYTDPSFAFADLGKAEIVGDFERLQSTSFPHGSNLQASATAGASASKLNGKGGAR